MLTPLPIPSLPHEAPPVDPYRHREPYVRLLSAIWHAERAAREGFELLQDPAYVRKSELLSRASQKLIADEAKHLRDIETIVGKLHGGGILPPSLAAQELWSTWRTGAIFALPFKPVVASLFCLFSEGLGYAVLYNMAQITMDPEIRRLLLENVEDEKSHLRLSMTNLRDSLGRDSKGFAADFPVYTFGYGMMVKNGMREYRPYLAELGQDYNAFTACSLRFVAKLLLRVVEESGQSSRLCRLLDGLSAQLWRRPGLVKAVYAASYLPEPPLARRLIHAWGERSARFIEREREEVGSAAKAVA
jgi:rubrerythrin